MHNYDHHDDDENDVGDSVDDDEMHSPPLCC